ncbi:MAG: histidine kinase [Ilumatobacteraceae bacterium]
MLLALASSLPLALRRRRPAVVLAVVVAAQVGLELADAYGPGWLAATFAAYTLTSRSPAMTPRRILLVVGAACIPVTIVSLLADRNPLTFLPSVIVLTLVMLIGDRVRRSRDLARQIATQAAEQQRQAAEQALRDERTRIARELHDVVAHSLSAMVIQAAAARRQLTGDLARAEQVLLDVEATGRSAMHEMRRVLGVLRSDGSATAQLAPQPSIEMIAELVEAAGDLPVRLHVADDASLADVPAAVGVSAYRVVQEALTNVRRHAGVVRVVDVTVCRSAGELAVEVVDDGRGASVPERAGGFGLVGMRERVGMFAGTLVTGPRQGGGWRVRAVFPLDVAA